MITFKQSLTRILSRKRHIVIKLANELNFYFIENINYPDKIMINPMYNIDKLGMKNDYTYHCNSVDEAIEFLEKIQDRLIK